jgi:hypothetical protein
MLGLRNMGLTGIVDKREWKSTCKAPAYGIIPLNVAHPACGNEYLLQELGGTTKLTFCMRF